MPPFFGGAGGKVTGVLAFDIQAGLFAVTKQVSVVVDALITQFDAQVCEIVVIGVRQRVRQIERARG